MQLIGLYIFIARISATSLVTSVNRCIDSATDRLVLLTMDQDN